MAIENPIKFLCKTENRFFSKNGELISLSRNLEPFAGLQTFRDEILDIVEYRAKEFKWTRCNGKE